MLQSGDSIELGPAPALGVTAAAINRIYYGEDRDLTPIYSTPELARHCRSWADHRRTIWHEDDERKGRIGTAVSQP